MRGTDLITGIPQWSPFASHRVLQAHLYFPLEINFTEVRLRPPRAGTAVFLPQLDAAAELSVIDLVMQHDRQPNRELASCRHSRLTQFLLLRLAPGYQLSPYRSGRKAPDL